MTSKEKRQSGSGAKLAPVAELVYWLTASWLVQNMAELRFAGFRESMRCTAGRLAEALAKRSAGGVDDLAGALRGWMSSEQAREVQWHVEKGRIVLWLEPPTSEDVDTACARLVQASPHLVELCNIDYNP